MTNLAFRVKFDASMKMLNVFNQPRMIVELFKYFDVVTRQGAGVIGRSRIRS